MYSAVQHTYNQIPMMCMVTKWTDEYELRRSGLLQYRNKTPEARQVLPLQLTISAILTQFKQDDDVLLLAGQHSPRRLGQVITIEMMTVFDLGRRRLPCLPRMLSSWKRCVMQRGSVEVPAVLMKPLHVSIQCDGASHLLFGFASHAHCLLHSHGSNC